MELVEKKYIVDSQNKRIAVQIDINTYQKIEEILENYALVQLMRENEGEETLNINQAKAYYKNLAKSN